MPASQIIQARVRLVPAAAAAGTPGRSRRRYRPLVVGPAILRRPADATGPWIVDVSADGTLLPLAAPCSRALRVAVARHRAAGLRCRIATALACPADVSRLAAGGGAATAVAGEAWSEIYGWAILHQPPGLVGRAFVDADAALPDLPACFELPLELLDRMAFLEARGIRTRPLAVITRPEDFVMVAGTPRNRYRPDARFHKPVAIDRLV